MSKLIRYARVVLVPILVCAASTLGLSARGVRASPTPIQTIDDATLKLMTTTMGGADVLPTTRTVVHWWGSTFDPHNGVTYGYNMVGGDPNNCSGAACSVTIEADVTPIIVNVDGLTFSGADVLAATLASPQFALNDYGSAPAATSDASNFSRGAGGILSQGDAGNPLQLLDATMRAQFNKTGSSNYHLILHPNVLPAVTINVPNNQGTLRQGGRGVVFPIVSYSWWGAQINNLENQADATHLPIYLTNDVLLYFGNDVLNCCVFGFHGTRAGKYGAGNVNSNGNAVVQTFVWASWNEPGQVARPDGGTNWGFQDINALSHEIAEWADDPFVNNTVEPWQTPTAPDYGCASFLETGDPVGSISFAMGTNTFQQGPNPNGTQSADGYYHPEDEAFLPWFMRVAPNTVSEPTQSNSLNIGRYTLMGDLNRFAGFRQPATGC
jgi:hypothetical protein